MTDTIEMGWAAPKIAEQFPELPVATANRLQMDSDSITHLSMRGIITRAEKAKMLNRFSKIASNTLRDERASIAKAKGETQ